jgi:hypothetical protein
MTYGEAGDALGVHPGSLRYAAATGTVLIRWEGARQPTVWTVPPPQTDPHDARIPVKAGPRARLLDGDRAGGPAVLFEVALVVFLGRVER